MQEMQKAQQRTVELRGTVADLTDNVQELEDKIEAAEDPAVLEEKARNELLMQKEGEYIIEIPNLATESGQSETPEVRSPQQEWQTLLFAKKSE